MGKKTGIPRNKAILLIGVIFLLAILATLFIYMKNSIVAVQEYDYYLSVVEPNNVGFNVDTSALYFGNVGKGATGQRYIIITNKQEEPLKALIYSSGQHSEWVVPSDNNFIIKAGETKELNMTVYVPKTAQYGDYEGKVQILLKKI